MTNFAGSFKYSPNFYRTNLISENISIPLIIKALSIVNYPLSIVLQPDYKFLFA